jgi:hypothetical protein
MNRRELIKLAGLTSLSVGLTSSRRLWADPSTDLPLFLNVHAGGGWDPTSLCDPKGRADENAIDPVNHYFINDIGTPSVSSPIRWAPMGNNAAFFQAHYDKLLVVNGIDTSTNNHGTGTRYINSGQLEEGYPSFAAMYTAHRAAHMPLGYITNGGYDITRGITPRTRLGELSVISAVAEPDLDRDRPFHLEEIQARLEDYRHDRLTRLLNASSLPKLQVAMSSLANTRNGENELKRLNENLPDLDAFNTRIGQQGAIAIAGYRAGLTASANLVIGGFDTHGNHDQNQANAMTNLTDGLMELWNEIEQHGLEDRVLIMVNSDFGRTPRYNEGNGKDHWSITSTMFMGAGIQGNRVLGATDAGVQALPINLDSLAMDPTGTKIQPSHIHAALRQWSGIDQSSLHASYPLNSEVLKIFT